MLRDLCPLPPQLVKFAAELLLALLEQCDLGFIDNDLVVRTRDIGIDLAVALVLDAAFGRKLRDPLGKMLAFALGIS